MTLTKGNLALLCLGWAFALLLGVTVGINAPFLLLVIWTVLTLL